MKKLLKALLSGLLVIGNTSLIYAEEEVTDVNETILETEALNPETLHVSKLGEMDEEPEMESEQLPYKYSDTVRVSIVLDAESTIDAGYSMQNYAENKTAQNYRSQLKAEQDAVAHQINAVVSKPIDVKWNLTLAVNIISADVMYGDIAKIRNVAGVKDVFIENQYEAYEDEINTVNTSSFMTGAAETWANGYSGAGSKVAIIDTGLDVDHQSFNADAFSYSISELGMTSSLMTKAEVDAVKSQLNGSGGTYLTAKLPFVYNYVDKNTTVNHLSDTQGEHGSHVAGIAAANRYIKNGNGYAEAATAVKAVGMAPDAQVMVMKVFGSGGGAYDSDYMAAIEDAIALGCDSANLSLGSAAPGFTYANSYQDTLNSLAESDSIKLVVTISAGNSSSMASNLGDYLYIDDVNMHTGGSPGSFINSLGTASADNIGNTGAPLKFGSNDVYYTESEERGGGMVSLADASYSYVYIDSIGDGTDYSTVNNAESLSGKIVIVNRGELAFVDKGNNLINYNPKALIVANNESGTISMDLSSFNGEFPMVSITLLDAGKIKNYSTSHKAGSYTYYTGTVTVTSSTQTGQAVDREDAEVSSFSSWGVPGSLIMKPEITAPGGNIYSVYGTNKNSSNVINGGTDQYELMSGTSMAAPHMAGLSAVLAQYLSENANEFSLDGYSRRALNQSLLMSTATPMKNNGRYVSILQQGSGLADVSRAVSAAEAKSVIMMDENDDTLTALTGEAKDGKVKAELGDNPSRSEDYTYTFTVYNQNTFDVEYTLATDIFTQARIDDDGQAYMSTETVSLSDYGWTVSHVWGDVAGAESHDVNIDGFTDDRDVDAILEFAAKKAANELDIQIDTDAADLDGNNDITTADAYQLIEWLKADHSYAAGVVPAKGSRKVIVTIKPDHSANSEFDDLYPSGAYVEGFTYVTAQITTDEGKKIKAEHSIPVLGFYGSWTDPSMFDNTSYIDTLYGTDKESYSGNEYSNYMTLRYNGKLAKFAGNPYTVEDTFPEDKLAVNSSSQISTIYYNLIRSAGTTGFAISKTDGINGNITDVFSSITGNEVTGLYYYANQRTWQNTGTKNYSFNKTPESYNLNEGDTFRIGYYAIPEYNAMMVNDDLTDASAGILDSEAFDEILKSDVLGKGAYVGYDFTIDNTAPEITNAVVSGNTLSVSANDNINLAYIAVMSLDGSVTYAEAAPGTDKYTISFDASDAIANASGYVAVFAGDYAGNETAVAIKVNDNTSIEETAYVQTDTLNAGSEYLIVSRNTSGDGYALGHSGTSASADAVTVNIGISETGNSVFIKNSDVDSTSVWTTAQASGGMTFANNGSYIRRNNSSLNISSTNSSNTWTWSNGKLKQGNSYSLTFSSNRFSLSTSSSAANIYLFEKRTIKSDVDPYAVSSVSITPSELDLYKGNETNLVADVSPLTAENRDVTWTSSNTSVAVVNAEGHVTASGKGTATITVTSNDDTTKSSSCTVNVISANKDLYGIVWDEEGGVYFSSFNTDTLPSYTKLHNDSKGVDLVSALMSSSSTLYAGTLNSSYETVLYSVNRSNYNLTEYGTNYVGAFDMAPASTQYTGYFIYPFAKYLIFGNLAPETEDDIGTFSGFPYGLIDLSETSVGDGYAIALAVKSLGTTSSEYYFLDDYGKIWQTKMSISSSVSFGTPTLVVDTGIGSSLAYQNLYYDGTYLYWAHYADNTVELIVINPSTGNIYHAGSFADSVWPVSGLYVNGKVAPSEAGDEITGDAQPLNIERLSITREQLITEDIINRLNAEKAGGTQSAGSINSIKDHTTSLKETKAVSKLIAPAKKADASATEDGDEDVVTVSLSDTNEITHNGLYKVEYDSAVITYEGYESNAAHDSVYPANNTVNNIRAVYVAFADGDGFEAGEEIAKIKFSKPDSPTQVSITDLENGNNEEPTVITIGSKYTIEDLSLNLESPVGVKCKVYVPEEEVSKISGLVWFDGKWSDPVLLSKLKKSTVNGKVTRVFTTDVATPQLRDTIKVKLQDEAGAALPLTYNGVTTTEGQEYTAYDHIEEVIENSTNADLVRLAKTLDDLGKYSQYLFDYNTDNIEGDLDPVEEIPAGALDQYAMVETGTAEGIKYSEIKLEFASDTVLRVYFELTGDNSYKDYTFTVDGEEVTPQKSGSRYVIKKSQIASALLDEEHVFKVCKKGSDNGIEIKCSALSYVQKMLSDETNPPATDLRNVLIALYWYNDAANKAFNQ